MIRRSRYAGPGHVPLWLFLPTLIPVIALSVVPLVQGLWMGFTDYTLGASETRFIWFENFARMLRDSQFWASFGVGAIWTLSVTAGVVIFGMGLALLLNAKLPLQGLARVLVLIPWAIPPIIKGVIWRLVYHPQAGFLNNGLLAIGVLAQPIDWLNNFTWSLPAVVLVGIWTGLPQATVVLLAGLQSIPDELFEAAKLDGASAWALFRFVTLPLLMPVILATVALEFMWQFNSFGLVYTLTEGGPAGTTRLPMLFAYEEAFRFGNLAYASALGTAMVIVVGAIVLYTVRGQIKGETR